MAVPSNPPTGCLARCPHLIRGFVVAVVMVGGVPGFLRAQAVDTLRGRTTLPDGAPASGTTITIGTADAPMLARVVADSTGTYVAAVPRSPQYTIVAGLPGYMPVRAVAARTATLLW